MNKIDSLRAAKSVIEGSNYPNVRAVGIGYKFKNGKKTKDLAVMVFVTKKISGYLLRNGDVIPRTLTIQNKTVETDVIESGEIKALRIPSHFVDEPHIEPLTDRVRPLKPGYSVGHPDITAGTIGCFVKSDGKICILSNNHVLANVNRASIGDEILQPGKYDGGGIGDSVAKLKDFGRIEMISSDCPFFKAYVGFGNFLAKIFDRKSRIPDAISPVSNLVDCAIAEVDDGIGVDYNVPSIGKPAGLVEAELGMKVRKTGRTTEYTENNVITVEATVNVNMGDGNMAIFVDQIIFGYMSAGGDSGSAIFDSGTNLVGLLFAGSDQITIANRIQNVFDELKLELP